MALRDAMWLENAGAVYNAGDYRRLLEALVSGPGVARFGDLAVTQQSPVAMGVAVARGTGLVLGTESTNQGLYGVSNDAAVNVSLTAAHASLGRIDVVCLRIRDDEYSGASHVADFFVVAGTPSGTPVVPTAPANTLVLARVTVGAAVGSITTAAITDMRATSPGAWGTAWGRVAVGTLSAVAGAGGFTVADVPGLSCTFTAVAGRRYRVTCHAITHAAAGGTGFTDQSVYVLDGNGVQLGWSFQPTGTYCTHVVIREDYAPSAGSATVKAAIARGGGSGNIEVYATAALPAQIAVYDVGPT